MGDQKAIIIGISGCSSSGKTTLARLLRDIFPHTFILHQDDFYKPEEEIPIKHGLRDWDCPEALSIPDMESALAHIHETGTFPPTLLSKEDQNSVGSLPITLCQLSAAKDRVLRWLDPSAPGNGHLVFPPPSIAPSKTPPPKICIIDGFLLYVPPDFNKVMNFLDVKLFLLVSREQAMQRRKVRDGYVTLEGFWADPPGYVETIVWPNYAEAHAWMFKEGNAEKGELQEEVLEKKGIKAQVDKGMDVPFGETLDWAVGVVMEELERIVLGSKEKKAKSDTWLGML